MHGSVGLDGLDASFNWTQYDGVVEMVSTLYYVAEEWENVATAVRVLLFLHINRPYIVLRSV